MEGNLEVYEDHVWVSINPKIYPLDVIFSASYLFTDRCYVLVDGDPKEEIIIELRPKEKEDLRKLGREFNNELINYANYAVQSIRNAGIREALLKRVLMTNVEDGKSEDKKE